MLTLFEDEPGGFRLEYFEFYNWGGFHNTIRKISPRGESSLLTGANGSGKTTLVDALVTLLVPPGKRHYNQSSGADKKKERTEESYVLGAYGSRRNDEAYTAVVEYLRTKKDYSLLLGVFKNKSLNKELTLGQIRLFRSEGLKKYFFSAPMSLSLKKDLLPLDGENNYRKRWKNDYKVTFYDSFTLYMKHFIPILGLRSEKGLNLFSHIVGVKVLGNLNEFIRNNMLDTPDMEEHFAKLYTNYDKLFHAHQKIELADKQLELLEPINKKIDKYESLAEEVKKAEKIKELIPGFYARKIKAKLEEEIFSKEEERTGEKEARELLEQEREAREKERRQLESAIDRDDTTQRIKGIENEIERIEERKRQKKKNYDRYIELAELLEFHKIKKEEDFSRNKKKALELEKLTGEKEADIRDRLYKANNEINKLNEEKEILEKDILSLAQRKNNIPRKSIEIRQRITQSLGLQEAELPFAGELIRVKEEERDWELAAERLLHNFGLCLLVDKTYYEQVNRFVNKNNLKGRLIYFKTTEDIRLSYSNKLHTKSLIYKLEVKKDSPYSAWVEEYLNNSFDYACVDKMTEFSKEPKAVTREGLIKSGKRHEKDDRSLDSGRINYILGWDNKRKIASLKQELREIMAELEKKGNSFQSFENQRKKLEQRKDTLVRFKEFSSFNELFWWGEEKKLKELQKEKETLESESQALNELCRNLEKVKTQLNTLREDLRRLDTKIGGLETRIADLVKKKKDYSYLLKNYEGISFEGTLFSFPPEAAASGFEELEALRDREITRSGEELEKQKTRFREGEKRMLKEMGLFISPVREILNKYPGWESYTLNLRAEVEYCKDFRDLYKSVSGDDLPRYKKEFREFLNDKMIEDLIDFKESLEQGEREIEQNINELNSALKGIEYNKSPSTYIMLKNEKSRDQGVVQFQGQLKNVLGDVLSVANREEGDLENLFKRMQKFILDLQEDGSRRKKVLDVRNWRRFAAEERHLEDHSQKYYYEDSQSLSGGEKAKLAYTILASAIAYQFNISGGEDHSFRFAIVDEAFSKVDPENSVYAMELFKKLELQLMVVTPRDNIHIVEKYIQSVHFVESNGRTSSLCNLTLEEYEEKKQELEKVSL